MGLILHYDPTYILSNISKALGILIFETDVIIFCDCMDSKRIEPTSLLYFGYRAPKSSKQESNDTKCVEIRFLERAAVLKKFDQALRLEP